MLTLTTLTSLLGIGSAFVITDCDAGTSKNFGDNKCQIWTGRHNTFESNAGCTLQLWSEGNCQGEVFQTTTQNDCQEVPFGVVSALCRK